MNNENKTRNYGIDIIRIIAVMLVLSVHFFLNTKYYGTEMSGLNMHLQGVIRNFCMACVPLFMVITGFLNKKKKYNKKFLKSLISILIIWLFYSVIEYFTLNIINNSHDVLNFKDLLFSITSFNACGYSWYIEMYIGLYLISPLINNAYDAFDEKNKKYLTIILLFVFLIPETLNAIFNGLIHIPNWWMSAYPIGYYILGKYLSENKINLKKKNIILLLIFNMVLTYSYSYISSIEFNTIPTAINTILIFFLFYDVNVYKGFLKKIIVYMSGITLDIYLASSLIDKLVYPYLNKNFGFDNMFQQELIIYAPIVVIIVFMLSTIYASIRKLIIKVR